jgi:non-heme chloroperoxidase
VAVIWAYRDLFGNDRLARLVFGDQRPTLVRQPEWSDAEARLAGRMQTFPQLEDMCHRLRSDQGWDTLVEVLGHMVSPDLPEERFQALLQTNRPMTNATRAALWFDQCTKDWRDLIPMIELPALVVHGLGSMIPTECQQWIADRIPGAQFATIPAESGGSHFAFWENPTLFSEVVMELLPRPLG